MKAAKKISIFLVLLLVCVFLLQACLAWGAPVTYEGKNVDLYSEAIHSLLGIASYGFSGILILEEDEYGRKLFTASLRDGYYDGQLACIFISQKSDDQYVYYYEDINYEIKKQPRGSSFTKEAVYERFSSEEIELLKKRNDWEKEKRSKELFKAPIAGNKFYLSNVVSENTMTELRDSLGFLSSAWGYVPLCQDGYENTLMLLSGNREGEPQGDNFNHFYAVLFSAEGKLKSDNAVMEVTDIWDYRDQMIAFKEANGWNKP